MEQWVYKGTLGKDLEGKIIDLADLDQAKQDGWREYLRQPGEGETPQDLPQDTPVELEGADELTELRKRAEALGIEVDGRWGVKRLLKAVEEHGGNG